MILDEDDDDDDDDDDNDDDDDDDDDDFDAIVVGLFIENSLGYSPERNLASSSYFKSNS